MPREWKKKTQKQRVWIWIALSLLLHSLLIFFPKKIFKPSAPPVVEVERIILPEDKASQVVELPDMEPDKEPSPDAKYLSKFNKQIEKETKAPLVGKPSPGEAISEEQKEHFGKKLPSLADLSLPSFEEEQVQKKREGSLPATDDYLPEVKTGKETLLNAREFVFYSYYERIKERLRMFWTPKLRHVVNNLYAKGIDLEAGDYMTSLHITLHKTGEIKSIELEKSSNYNELDNVAIVAFKEASPFPNPPSGMIDAEGLVDLRWNFILQHRTSILQVFLNR